MKSLRLYEAELLQEAATDLEKTYTQMKAFLEKKFGRTCIKNIMKQWMQSPFTGLLVVPEVLRGDYGRLVRHTPVQVAGVRSRCIWCRCPDPDYEIALFSDNTYATYTEMCAAFMEGDRFVMATIQKVWKDGDSEDLIVQDYVDARSYAERTGFCGQTIEQVEEVD